MNNYEIESRNYDYIPGNRTSYSLFLVSDRSWLLKTTLDQRFSIYSSLRSIGKIISNDHIFFWLYIGMIGSYSKATDLEVISKIFWDAFSFEDIKAKIAEWDKYLKNHMGRLHGDYDIERSDFYCKNLNLDMMTGPFLAFYDKVPNIPLAYQTKRQIYQIIERKYTKPKFLLGFGGMDYREIIKASKLLSSELSRRKVKNNNNHLDEIRNIWFEWLKNSNHEHLHIIDEMNNDRYIFISYAIEDREIVYDLNKKLQEFGYSTWLDDEKLKPGQLWEVEIEKAIENCWMFIACLSSNYVAKRGYVQAELKLALKARERIPTDKSFIIPVVIEQCEIPRYLDQIQWLSYDSVGSFEKLADTLLPTAQKLTNFNGLKSYHFRLCARFPKRL
ncbi:MAG: toll/interleukin-1 receptor domain-containing protein, partial [Tissierellales bacterium]|nr:toll/interleukin-1 receptor domain-containing protein [Tissierellales bacterium]